jgi:uncharacterized protein (DUF433 family)
MSMHETLLPATDNTPLRGDEGGALRVGKSRVTLDVVVREFESGMTAEDIVRAYDTLELADVYEVIGYYLRHRVEVKAYLNRREEEAAHLRSLIESGQPPCPTKEELLKRRREKDRAEASN